jgi:cell division protein FtsQ
MELSLPLSRRLPRRGATSKSGVRHTFAQQLAQLLGNRVALRVGLCALVAVPLLGGGWLWLRNSSLVSVRHVHITGVEGIDGVQIRTALDDAAARMTTLNFSAAALRPAVAQYPIVGALRVRTSFPHTVSIAVTERPPVAALLSSGQRTAVAADGTVLGSAVLSSSLPTIDVSVDPAQGARLRESSALAAVAVLAAAPARLERYVVRAYTGPEGLTLAMRNGLLVYFGDATRPHAKWLSLARVLVSPSAAGASYVDVRLPERPAAGFSSASSSSTAASSSTLAQAGSSNETAATLAASLEAAIGGGSSVSAPSAEPNPAEAAASNGGEASSPSGAEADAASPGGEASGSPSTAEGSPAGTTAEAVSPPAAGG